MRTLARRRFECSPSGIREARLFLRETLAERASSDTLDDLVLALSELATNAVLHAVTPFAVAVHANALARVEVEDGSIRIPQKRVGCTVCGQRARPQHRRCRL